MAELAALAETAGSEVLDAMIQRRDRPDPATYIGSGKAVELRDVVVETGADTVICDGELTPSQLRKLEEVVKVKVIDRTALILDIFAQHASSREGKAQVALAQMQYMLPRLRGWGESMSRQAGGRVAGGGGIGTRGPGETKIETDRRRIRAGMAKLRKDIAGMATVRETKRQERVRSETPSVAIAGYTNAGQVLDPEPAHRRRGARGERPVRDPRPDGAQGRDHRRPAVHPRRHRRLRPAPAAPARGGVPLHPGGGRRRGPDPARGGRLRPRPRVAARGGAGRAGRRRRAMDMREIVVINKADAGGPAGHRPAAAAREALAWWCRRAPGEGLAELVAAIEAELPRPDITVDVLLPYTEGGLLSQIHADGEVLSLDHGESGTLVSARVVPGARRRAGAVLPALSRLRVGTRSPWAAWRSGCRGGATRPGVGTSTRRGCPRGRGSSHVAERLGAVEVNATFYRQQRPETFAGWYDATPPGTVVAVKGHRYATHVVQPDQVRAPLANFFASGVLGLREKLGPVLWQLPPTRPYRPELLEALLGALPRSTREAAALAREHDARFAGRVLPETDADRPVRHALEVRHPSYLVPAFVAQLRRHDVALVVSDSAGRYPVLADVTSDLVYVRLHGHSALYRGGYDDARLAVWARRVRSWRAGRSPRDLPLLAVRPPRRPREVVVFFDNDADGPRPARRRGAAAAAHPGVTPG